MMNQKTIKISWSKMTHFTVKQKEAERLADQYDFLLFGGAAGPGKSYFLRWYPIKFLHKQCFKKLGIRGVRVGLFCEDYPALWDRQICRIPFEFPNQLGKYNKQQHEFILKDTFGGGVLCFRNLDDPSKYMSAEFALIAIDELTKNKKDVFDFLRLRKRWPGIERTKFIAGSNPGGIGHIWVKKKWLDNEFDENEKEANQFVFLPGRAEDNPYLPNSYLQALDSLPEKMRKAYKEGNWDVFEGQYFSEWDRNKHVTIPFAIPFSWKRFRAYDHGREAPACCKWYAVDPDGRVWVYREFYKSGLNVNQIAQKINELSMNEIYEYSVADPSIFAHHGFIDRTGGETIAETFAKHNIVFIPGSNRRIDGWNLMHQRFYWDKQILPMMIYFKTCYNSVRTIPTLIHDEKKPEDLDTRGEDHAADCDRYFLLSLHDIKSPVIPLTDTERKIQRMKEEKEKFDLNKFYFGE